MSNTQVGPIYDSIIQDVINAVRVDFEENGIDETVLETLKKTWQHKLSQLNVAQFPWDPKPEPPPAPPANNGPTQASNAPVPAATPTYTQATLNPQAPTQTLTLPGSSIVQNANGVTIKQEPGIKSEPGIKQEPGVIQHPPFPANAAPQMAAVRAAQALQNQYGERAAASINAIHSGMVNQLNAAQRQQQMQQHLNGQQPQQYRPGMPAPMQQQRMQQHPQQQVPHPGGPNGLPAAQHDGAADETNEEHLPSINDREAIDRYFHAQLLARAKEREAGGLMMPLSKNSKNSAARSISKRQAAGSDSREGVGSAQVDGPDDDDSDADAINSDLDDPNEGLGEDSDDDDCTGHMMLCMYDKVQRVKNKWWVYFCYFCDMVYWNML